MARQPFFGQGSGPLIARMDMNAATAIGREYGKAFREMGQAAGSAANAFIQRKNEKKRVDSSTNAFIQLGFEPDVAKAMAKDPNFQNAAMKKEALDQQGEIARMGIRADIAKSNRIRSQEAAKMEEEQRRIQQAEGITREANQFLRTRPQTETPEFLNLLEQFSPDQIPGTPEFEAKELSEPMGARPPLMASFATDKPNFEMFNVGKSPIEQQLPKSFQGQAGRIIDMADNKEISPEAADLALNRIQAQAMAERKDGPTRSEILAREKFEYGKAQDAEENKPMPPADSKYAEATLTAIDDALGFLTDGTKKFFSTGVVGQALSNIAGTDARSLRAKLDTITSGVGFGRLSDMREASKTGGALGNVSEIELRQLNASMGSLDPNQKPSELKKTLETIKEQYESTVRVLKAEKYAYDNELTFKSPKEAMNFVDNFNASSPQQPAPQSRDELLKQEADLQRRLNERLLNNPPMQQFRGI